MSRLNSDGLAGDPGSFKGSCSYHEDCVEGMANAAAIARRCACDVSELANVPDTHPAWQGSTTRGRSPFKRTSFIDAS